MKITDECAREGMKIRSFLRWLGAVGIITIVTLAALEIILRVVDLRELREGVSERSLSYRYDDELGWMPVPGSSSDVTNARTIHASHNSLGVRDEEFVFDGQPTIMFLGDSFVWGLDAEANERFSELLKPRITGYKSLAAGVSGYGTDQEYLLLKKIWSKVKPAVVVLIFCTDNDREDNSTNIRYEGLLRDRRRWLTGVAWAAGSQITLASHQGGLVGPPFLVGSACERRLSEGSASDAARAGPDRAAGRQDQGVRGSKRGQIPGRHAIHRCPPRTPSGNQAHPVRDVRRR
jgi:hypothetical protein